MAVWYKVEKTAEGLEQFLKCNWEFHDFRIERVDYHAAEDYTEVFLGYDSKKEGVLLRFLDMIHLNLPIYKYYEGSWLDGTGAFVSDKGSIVWVLRDDFDFSTAEEQMNAMESAGWIESWEICWAVTDGKGAPVEMPPDRIDQVWEDCNRVKTYYHFDLKPYIGNEPPLLP